MTPAASPTTSPSPSDIIQSIDGLTIDTSSDRGGMAALVTGTATVDARGCRLLEAPGTGTIALVWPKGTRWTDAGRTAVSVPSGGVIRSGDALRGGGGYIERIQRSEVSMADDVSCLPSGTISYVVVNADVAPTR